MFRLRFYFAWKLGQSICYAAGFGFSGWTEDGKEQWELVRNGELTRVEVRGLFTFSAKVSKFCNFVVFNV